MKKIIFCLALFVSVFSYADQITVASKKFTENVILGEIITRMLQDAGVEAVHRRELGGTQVLWKGLLRGDVDVYVEYSGTLMLEMFRDKNLRNLQDIRKELKSLKVRMTKPFGFNNTYAIGLPRKLAEERGIKKISDLNNHLDLRIGLTAEFMNRADGWPGLSAKYQLKHANVRGMDHDLAYRGLKAGDIDVVDTYSTDAEIPYYDLTILEDDREFFPRYEAVIIFRDDFAKAHPEAALQLRKLAGTINQEEMTALNAAAKVERRSEAVIASEFLSEKFDIESEVVKTSFWTSLKRTTRGHLYLVIISMTLTIALALPLGIIAAKYPGPGQIILGVTGILQTIPSLALLVFMIPWLGIGPDPAIAALFLYGLLPIVRNTYTGIRDIPPSLLESAMALGLPPMTRLWKIELPLASRSILAGIKTSIVINIGTATLGALIGAGGYGQPILTGIRLDDMDKILQGAVPAAILAIVAQGFFEIAERYFVPKGLRIKRESA